MRFPSRTIALAMIFSAISLVAQTSPPASTQATGSSSSRQKKSSSAHLGADLDVGTIANGIYRNPALGLTCKIPAGWVLRTAEMNARDEAEGQPPSPPENADKSRGQVLLAAFSRPPEAKGEDVNASIVIAEEPVATYPGLKEAAQYFAPLTEVSRAQGFTVDEEPYEIAIGAKTVVRGDFHKNVGTRVMRQSTLAFLARGSAVSITVIGGTEEEVEE
jgi:hypothetical protein